MSTYVNNQPAGNLAGAAAEAIEYADYVSELRSTRIAAYARGPMVVPSARANSTAVTAEQTLKWSDGSLVVVGTAGTTAASEPSGLTDGRPLTDGTAVVYHTGWKKAASDIDAPTVTQIANTALGANGLTEVRFANSGVALAYISSPDSLLVNNGGNYVYSIGGAFGNASATPDRRAAYAADPAPLLSLPTGEALTVGFADGEFYVEDSKFAITFHNFGGKGFILIDDQPVFAHSYTTASGNYLMFDFGGVFKKRKVSVNRDAGEYPNVRGVAVTAQGRVSSVENRIGDNLLVLGDSFTNTVSPDISAPQTTHILKRYLGFEGMLMLGLGGSGVTVRPNANTYNHRDMLASTVNRVMLGYFQPKHVLVYTGTNDVNFGAGIANSADETVRLWDDIHNLLPNAKITTVDCTLGTAVSGSTNHYAYAAAIKAKHAQYATPNMRLIEAVGTSTSTAWVYGTGQISTALGAGTGNASYYHGSDNSHPGPAGARFRARQIANEMIRVWGGNY